MNYMTLKAELAKPEYAGLSDAEATAALNALQEVAAAVPMRSVLRWAAETGAIVRLEEAASTGQPATRRISRAALVMMSHPHVPELDVTDPEIAGLMATLVSEGVFTQGEIDALGARGVESRSRAAELGLGRVREGDVRRARGGI